MDKPSSKLTRRSTIQTTLKEVSRRKHLLKNPTGIQITSLTPLTRLARFKKSVEKQREEKNTKNSKRRVTFALMETETEIVVNGSHEPVEEEEKILKPRKSVVQEEKENSVVPNGNGIEPEENVQIGEQEIDEDNNKKNLHQNVTETKKENTPKKQANKRVVKDVSPPKRELRPRESTPLKYESKRRGTPVKVLDTSLKKNHECDKSDNQINLEPPVNGEDLNPRETEEKVIDSAKDISVITIEDSVKEESIVSVNESVGHTAVEEPKGIFSALRRSFKSNSLMDVKDKCEASSSQSIICLDSPSVVEKYTPPNSDIKGRKPIHSFSRFPGRNVSFESFESRKRRADNSFDEIEIKRFAGETESGSEKSPGWTFLSPGFGRVWSPALRNKSSSVPTSTPLIKKMDQDSMAVNYNEETKLSLNETGESVTFHEVGGSTPEKAPRKFCNIM